MTVRTGLTGISRAYINGDANGMSVARRRRKGLSRRASRMAVWEAWEKAAGKREMRCFLPLRLDMVKRAMSARSGCGRRNEKI